MRVLVVEDQVELAEQIQTSLRQQNFAVDIAHDGEDGHYLGEVEPYDAVVLDLGLPNMNGSEILAAWRAKEIKVPVLVLTARSSWTDKVESFDIGADDYLTKPFQMEELIARLKALIRRSSGFASPLLVCGNVTVDTSGGIVKNNGKVVELTAYEYKLLCYFIHNPNKVLSRSKLIEHIYEQDFDPDSNTVEVFVARLRKKLDVDYITTVRGLGYRLDPPEGTLVNQPS